MHIQWICGDYIGSINCMIDIQRQKKKNSHLMLIHQHPGSAPALAKLFYLPISSPVYAVCIWHRINLSHKKSAKYYKCFNYTIDSLLLNEIVFKHAKYHIYWFPFLNSLCFVHFFMTKCTKIILPLSPVYLVLAFWGFSFFFKKNPLFFFSILLHQKPPLSLCSWFS